MSRLHRVFYYPWGRLRLPWVFVVAAVVLGAVVVPIVAGAVHLDRVGCRQTAEQMDREWRYRFPAGCFVKTSTGWFPPEQVRQDNSR